MTVDIAGSETQLHKLTRPNVAVVGFAEGHLAEAPFEDESYEIWGINRLHTVTGEQRFTRWFNIHDLEKFHGEDAEHLEFLKNFGGPVYLRQQDLGKYDIPNQVPFPDGELVEAFGRYFNNTISWLLAYALSLDPKELGVYGVDMAQDALLNSEYSHQRPSCEYFLGIAAGRGIPVHMPKGSDLLKATHLYGFEDPDVWMQKMVNRLQETGTRKEKLKQELAQLENQRTTMIAAINQLDGAMQDTQYWMTNWVPLNLGERWESPNGQVDDSTMVEKEI